MSGKETLMKSVLKTIPKEKPIYSIIIPPEINSRKELICFMSELLNRGKINERFK